MAVKKGTIGTGETHFQQKLDNDSTRIKVGLDKFRQAMLIDAKAVQARGSGLPKDARDRLIR